MTPTELLQAARALITPPEKWNQGSQIQMEEDGEVSHCAYGALNAIQQGRLDVPVVAAVKLLHATIPQGTVILDKWGHSMNGSSWDDACRVCAHNNANDHDTVLAWFDRAIEVSKEA